ncbi:MAG: rRNA maturation RNase YbeY [Clostridia bacterium]|nr:rRNA maturation RNase YbeY [Clostridia bacterium]
MLIVNFSDEQNIKLEENVEVLINSACASVLEIENFVDDAEINVTLVDDEAIKELNAEFRNIDKSTDVLSFPLGVDGVYDINPENDCLMLGDVVISVSQALRQAREFGHSKEREIAYLTVHSVLHLLGYDHVDESVKKKIMRQKEEQALKKLGLEIRSESE